MRIRWNVITMVIGNTTIIYSAVPAWLGLEAAALARPEAA